MYLCNLFPLSPLCLSLSPFLLLRLCRCLDKDDLLPPENPLHCKTSRVAKESGKINVQCCSEFDLCNQNFTFNFDIFKDPNSTGKHLEHILIRHLFSFFFLLAPTLSLSLCLLNLIHTLLLSLFPLGSISRRCVQKDILFPTENPSWCNKSNTDTEIHTCCNAVDFCNANLQLYFPESPPPGWY